MLELDLIHKHVMASSRCRSPAEQRSPLRVVTPVGCGYYVFEADNLDESIELAARIPAARLGGAIEVRPLVER